VIATRASNQPIQLTALPVRVYFLCMIKLPFIAVQPRTRP
jgi:hypothetical protein